MADDDERESPYQPEILNLGLGQYQVQVNAK